MNAPAAKNVRAINLALQGGGAHGAFTWGVLDRLLDERTLRFEGISGTSAGAVNAVLVAYGLTEGGRLGAKKALEDFWYRSSRAGTVFSPLPTLPKALVPGGEMWAAATYTFFDTLTRTFSPYEYNPLNINPLRDIVKECVDFDALHKSSEIKLYISATNVRSGRVRIFDSHEVDLDVIMASACLPFIFKAVEIDGEHFWDGGYMGNPSLFPFFYNCDSRDVLIVHINPVERAELPMTAAEIMNRINEISFNSSLIDELRAINFVNRLISDDWLKDDYKDRLRHILVHSISSDKLLSDLSVASKFDVDWNFLTDLRDRGRQAADDWLSENGKSIGKHSTVDIVNQYLTLPEEMEKQRRKKKAANAPTAR